MGVYANGHLIFGLYAEGELDDKLAELEERDYERLRQLQTKHGVTVEQIGFDGVRLITTFSENVSAKNLGLRSIKPIKPEMAEEYETKITAFLKAIGINPEEYKPDWYLLGYMD